MGILILGKIFITEVFKIALYNPPRCCTIQYLLYYLCMYTTLKYPYNPRIIKSTKPFLRTKIVKHFVFLVTYETIILSYVYIFLTLHSIRTPGAM